MQERECQTPGLGRRGLVSLFITLFWSVTLSCTAEWSAASRVGQQFSSRIVFQATFCWKMPIWWYQDALWENVNAVDAIKAISRSQTSAWLPCLCPAGWFPGTAGLPSCSQPPLWFSFTLSLFYLYCIFPSIFIFIFYIQYTCSIRNSPLAHQNTGCQIKVQVTQCE